MYECHITIEPVFGDRLQLLISLGLPHGFKVADLLMQKRAEIAPERSNLDTFMTGHGAEYDALLVKAGILTGTLLKHGFKVWRVKVEEILFDTKRGDFLKELADQPARERFVGKVKELGMGYEAGKSEVPGGLPYDRVANFIFTSGDMNAVPDDGARYSVIETAPSPASESVSDSSTSDYSGGGDSGGGGSDSSF